jgi:ribosome biogenesis GTPase / thiamine phosphate phosphatase
MQPILKCVFTTDGEIDMTLKELGWEAYARNQAFDSSYARVALATREHFLLWTKHGETEAIISGRLRHNNSLDPNENWPCVGDWVVASGGVITKVLPRRTLLSRREPGGGVREQVLAANIDLLFVVSGLDHDYNPRRLERYLVLATKSGAHPIVVLNKADLLHDVQDIIRQTELFAPGVPVLAVSALTGWGLETIEAAVEIGETAALIGSSGSGKSTIVNRLIGAERQQTVPVRKGDSKGRHTTTRRELITTPRGWLLMDLPGLRELQLWANPEQLGETFSEIAELASRCRFRDCTHQQEPGCAVRDAGLEPARLANYRKLQRELRYLERESNAHLERELRKKWNAVEKAVRRHPKRQ